MKKAKTGEVPAIKHNIDTTASSGDDLEIKKSGLAKGSYRRQAFERYGRPADGGVMHLCVVCGFGVAAVLEVAHLDQNRKNDALENLALLCPNCHKMHDIGLLPTDVVRSLRDVHRSENWALRVKDAGKKAAATRKATSLAAKRSAAAKKAHATRTGAK